MEVDVQVIIHLPCVTERPIPLVVLIHLVTQSERKLEKW